MQDCADVVRGKGYYSPYGGKVAADNSKLMSYYVRGAKDAWLEENKADMWGEAIITKPVAVSEMHKWLSANPGCFIAAMPAK